MSGLDKTFTCCLRNRVIPVIVCLARIKHLLVASRGALGDPPGDVPKELLGVPGSLERLR